MKEAGIQPNPEETIIDLGDMLAFQEGRYEMLDVPIGRAIVAESVKIDPIDQVPRGGRKIYNKVKMITKTSDTVGSDN